LKPAGACLERQAGSLGDGGSTRLTRFLVQRAGIGLDQSLRVVQLLSKGFYNQTDHYISNGIRG